MVDVNIAKSGSVFMEHNLVHWVIDRNLFQEVCMGELARFCLHVTPKCTKSKKCHCSLRSICMHVTPHSHAVLTHDRWGVIVSYCVQADEAAVPEGNSKGKGRGRGK